MGAAASKQDVAVAAASFLNADAEEFGSKPSRERLRSLANVPLTLPEVEVCFPAEQLLQASHERLAILFTELLSVADSLAGVGTYGLVSVDQANQLLTVVRLLHHFLRVLLAGEDGNFLRLRLPSPESGEEEPFALSMVTVLQRLLFVQGFTVYCGNGMAADESLPRHKVDRRFTWYASSLTSAEAPTAAAAAAVPTPVVRPALTLARVEILEALLCLWGSGLYGTLDDLESSPVTLGPHAATQGYLPFTANLFCNLLATVLRYCTAVSSGGGWISGVSSIDEREAAASTMLLCLLIDYQPAASAVSKSPDSKEKRGSRNVYRLMVTGMRREQEVSAVLESITAALQTIVTSRKGLLRRRPCVPFFRELFVLLWNCLTLNPLVLAAATTGRYGLELVMPLALLLVESSERHCQQLAQKRARLTEGKESADGIETAVDKLPLLEVLDLEDAQGMLHFCCFFLLVLSAERDFAVSLNAPATSSQFPAKIQSFKGSYIDLIVIASNTVILNCLKTQANDSLISMLLTIISNVSSYVQGFCDTSCAVLLTLLHRFSKPSWLFSANYHYHNVLFLLDVFNNCIQYRYEGNACLVYSILRRAEDFRLLNDLQFPETTAANAVGWTPTPAWFYNWKEQVPIETCLRLIDALLPLVEKECEEKELLSQQQVEQFIRKTTVVGLLPVPHAIIVRNYQPNAFTALWFTSYLWCCIARAAVKENLVQSDRVIMFQRTA